MHRIQLIVILTHYEACLLYHFRLKFKKIVYFYSKNKVVLQFRCAFCLICAEQKMMIYIMIKTFTHNYLYNSIIMISNSRFLFVLIKDMFVTLETFIISLSCACTAVWRINHIFIFIASLFIDVRNIIVIKKIHKKPSFCHNKMYLHIFPHISLSSCEKGN